MLDITERLRTWDQVTGCMQVWVSDTSEWSGQVEVCRVCGVDGWGGCVCVCLSV